MKTVYLAGPIDGAYKIGHSRNPESRVTGLNLPVEPALLATVTTSRKGWLEAYMHAAFSHRRTRGEWFRLTDEEVALVCSVSHADTPDDLPAAVVALHDANERERKSAIKFTTIRVFKDDGDAISDLVAMEGGTAADFFRDICAPLVRERLAAVLEARLARVTAKQAAEATS
jgi:hypothetical protein